MSRRIHKADVAVTSQGALVVNVAALVNAPYVDKLIARALDEEGEIFIGIVVTEEEKQVLLERLDNAAAEALAMVIGKRGGS